MAIDKLKTIYGVSRSAEDEGLITSGSVVFGVEPTDDNLTVEKVTSTITVLAKDYHPDALYLLAVERNPSAESYPGDLTIYTYNITNISGLKERRTLHTTQTNSSAKIVQARDYLIQGLGVGGGSIQFGFVYGADVATTQTVYYKLYRV